jgi:hypothetical protein
MTSRMWGLACPRCCQCWCSVTPAIYAGQPFSNSPNGTFIPAPKWVWVISFDRRARRGSPLPDRNAQRALASPAAAANCRDDREARFRGGAQASARPAWCVRCGTARHSEFLSYADVIAGENIGRRSDRRCSLQEWRSYPINQRGLGIYCLGGPRYGSGFEEGWYRELRACHPHIFDRYFQLAIPTNDISQADLDRLLSSVGNRQAPIAEFRALNPRGLLGVALNRLEAYKEEINLQHAVPFITALFDTPLWPCFEEAGG